MTRDRAIPMDRERRLHALKSYIDAYECEHGVIAPAEIESQSQRASRRADAVRASEKQPNLRRPRGSS